MNDQQRAAFETWYDTHDPRTPQSPFDRALACKAYQAALESPEVQALRKDAERLDFLISEECQIQSISTPNEVRHRLGWPDYGEAQSEWFTNPRAAIDAAMEKQK